MRHSSSSGKGQINDGRALVLNYNTKTATYFHNKTNHTETGCFVLCFVSLADKNPKPKV